MVAELHTWEQVDKLAANFEERFGYEPIWYGNVDEVYAPSRSRSTLAFQNSRGRTPKSVSSV